MVPTLPPNVHIVQSIQQWVEDVSLALVERANHWISRHGFFTLALTGGRTPRELYARLAEPDFRQAVDWSRVKIFFGDERAVGPEHADSNYRMAWEAWLRDSPIPTTQIFRMEGEANDLDQAAVRYAAILTRQVPSGPTGFPALDLVLLGLGEDGHTASLFPDTRALNETLRVAVANDVARLGTRRLTLTYPSLEAAHEVWFLVTGSAKAERVAQVLGVISGGENLPASIVRPASGQIHWWLDATASGRLQS